MFYNCRELRHIFAKEGANWTNDMDFFNGKTYQEVTNLSSNMFYNCNNLLNYDFHNLKDLHLARFSSGSDKGCFSKK